MVELIDSPAEQPEPLLRRLLLLRPHPALRSVFVGAASPAVLKERLGDLLARDLRIDEDAIPVPVPQAGLGAAQIASIYTEEASNVPHNYLLPVVFGSLEEEAKLLAERPDLVLESQANPRLSPFPAVCPAPNVPIGTIANVRQMTRIDAVHAHGHRGQGVRIAIVDTGIDGTQVNVSGGHSLRPGVAPGQSPSGHGTMVAADVVTMAPGAMIFDYPLFGRQANSLIALASDAIRYYAHILTDMLALPGPWVVVNSWGVYDTRDDAPPGTPQHYASNPRHQLNVMVQALAAVGADVVFAAGNCGLECPSGSCGVNDRGPGRSIHGANSHPAALSVAAVTVLGARLGYSSQGPGRLSPNKPDLAAPSHFHGGGIGPTIHDGTSAACPVVAGAIAALRSKPGVATVLPSRMQDVLRQQARRDPGVTTWNGDTGFGLLDAQAAWHALP